MLLSAACTIFAQETKPGPDTIIFNNGETLAGRFVSGDGSSIVFDSDALGKITVAWSRIKSLHTTEKVAAIRNDVKLGKHTSPGTIPQGTLSMENQNIQLEAPPQPAVKIPVAQTNVVISQTAFQKALTHRPGPLADWSGSITAGATVVNATQNNTTFNGAISLVRAEPLEDWLPPRNRTSISLSASYGELSQPATPTVKTSILHGEAERDEYFIDGLFAFGQAAYDHNYSQGLDLQQAYGGGFGWTAIQSSNETLDLKGSASYIRQQFQTGPNQNLIGSTFAEHYARKFKIMTVDQHLSVTPAWNNLSAYSALFSTLLTMPVYKRLGVSTGIVETFLNNPPPGFQKNSFQFTLGLTYTLR